MTCVLCGKPIEIGEAWMETADGGTRRIAHAGCVYRDEPTHADRAWVPGDSDALAGS